MIHWAGESLTLVRVLTVELDFAFNRFSSHSDYLHFLNWLVKLVIRTRLPETICVQTDDLTYFTTETAVSMG